MEITRRNLLKLGAIFGAGSALPACAKKTVLKPNEESLPANVDEKFVSTFCGMCWAGCGLRVRKIGRHAVGVSGALDHPINQGGLCPKGAAILQELYHPDRLSRPLLSQGPRGQGHWTAIAWQEAFRLVSEKILVAKKKKKLPLAILGQPHQDIGQELAKELADSLGRNGLFVLGFPMAEPPFDAYQKMHGANLMWDLTKAKLFVSLGFDWLQSYPSHVEAQRVFVELRSGKNRQRTHIVQIEPRFSVSAAKADEWIPIRPGSEGILALALMRELIEKGIYDESFVAQHTEGFQGLKTSLEPFSIDQASQVTGVSQETIRLLTVKFLNLRPSAIITNRSSILTQMAIQGLNVLLGNIGPEKPFFAGLPDSSKDFKLEISDSNLPEVLLVDRANPLFTAPGKWKMIFEKIPFVVVVSSHLTETAASADLALPCHTPLEARRFAFHQSMEGKIIMNAGLPAVEPLYDTKDPGEIFLALKQRVFRDDSAVTDFDSYFKARLKKQGAARVLEENSEEPWFELDQSLQQSSISARPSGKIDLTALAQMATQFNLSQQQGQDENFPLGLYLFTPLAFSRGEGAHLPYLISLAGVQLEEMWETWVEIHPETAKDHGVSDGDAVWIESSKGKIKAKARVVPWAIEEVISVPIGFGHTAYGRWAKGIGANPMEIVEDLFLTKVRLKRV